MRVSVLCAVLLSLVVPLPASAVVYKWVDDKGVIGFTEDFGNIPEKYRKKARIVGEEEEVAAPVLQDKGEVVKGQKGPGVVEAKDAVQPVPGGPKKPSFGGRDENSWRVEFARARGELGAIRDQLQAVNGRLANPDQMSRTDYRSLDSTRKLLEDQEAIAKKRLETLTAEANKVGVPPELR